MLNQLKAERYKLFHSNLLPGALAGCAAILALSLAAGQFVIFGSGGADGGIELGFRPKAWMPGPNSLGANFLGVACASLAYLAVFWIVAGCFAAAFCLKENAAGTKQLSIACGTSRVRFFCCKAAVTLAASLALFLLFVGAFWVVESAQSGYWMTPPETARFAFWVLLCGMALAGFVGMVIFLCALLQSIGPVIALSCLHLFAGACVYIMVWPELDSGGGSLPLKAFLYANPIYYWFNFCSGRAEVSLGQLPFFLLFCLALLGAACLLESRRELK